MKKLLFVTQTLGEKQACGIGIIGDLLAEIICDIPNFIVDIIYTDIADELTSKIIQYSPDVVLYNYAPGSTPWLDSYPKDLLFPNIKHIRIMHDMSQEIADSYRPENYGGWRYVITPDPSVVGNEYIHIVNRILPCLPKTSYVDIGKPIIGSQGFGPHHKGYYKIAQQVLKEFDEAIIRLHIPRGYSETCYGYDNASATAKLVRDIVSESGKSGIEVQITHDFMTRQEIVDMLAQNTINCYFYDYMDQCGLASSPDYALASGRPIAVTKSHQMRHFWNLSPTVLIENSSLREIISNGTAPTQPLYEAYSKENVLREYRDAIMSILNR